MVLIRPESKVGIRGGIHFVPTEKSRKLGGGGRPEPALRTKPGWSRRLWGELLAVLPGTRREHTSVRQTPTVRVLLVTRLPCTGEKGKKIPYSASN